MLMSALEWGDHRLGAGDHAMPVCVAVKQGPRESAAPAQVRGPRAQCNDPLPKRALPTRD